MDQGTTNDLSRPEVQADLKAAVAARRELGPEMEDQVIDSFLDRLDERMRERGLALDSSAKPVRRQGGDGEAGGSSRHYYNPIPVVPASLGIAIPLLGIAGGVAGGVGVVVVMVAVVLINLLYVMQDRL